MTEENGFTLITWTKYRQQYGAVAPVGSNHTCITDACWTILIKVWPSLQGKIALKWVHYSFELPNNADPNMHMLEMFFSWFGIDMQYLHGMYKSPKKLFFAKQGIYFIGLDIGLPVEDDQSNNHAMVYDANLKHVYDNNRSVAIPIIEKRDLVNNRTAAKVFQYYFDKATSLMVRNDYKVGLKTKNTTCCYKKKKIERLSCPPADNMGPYCSTKNGAMRICSA